MENSSDAFFFVVFLLVGVLGLTCLGLYLSFGPPSKQLEEPWDRQED